MKNLPDCCNPIKIKEVKELIPSDDQLQSFTELFSSLGDSNRLKMILALSQASLCVHELAATIQSNTSAVSHQLRKLKDRNLVDFRRNGQVKYYFLSDDRLKQLVKSIPLATITY